LSARTLQEQAVEDALSRAKSERSSSSAAFTSTPIFYHVEVRTGDVSGASTDAKVFLQLHGDSGQTARIPLAKSKGHKDKFETGKTDEFEFEANDVGEIQQVTIGHDGSGTMLTTATWYLDTVVVKVPSLGTQYVAEADRWLSKNKGDGKTEVTLDVTAAAIAVADAYVCTTTTGSVSGATLDDATVYIMLYGEDGKSEALRLHNDDSPKHNYDKKGKVDTFRLEAEPLGEIYKLRVWHDGKGMFGASWLCQEIEIHDLKTDTR
jgi:hypothetical protein